MGTRSRGSSQFTLRSEEPLNGGPEPTSLGASLLTPNELFFVRNHGPVPELPPDHAVVVDGLVREPLRLTLADLQAGFERVELASTIACAGQRRAEMSLVEPIEGELPWGPEAVSSALWSGWRLRDVLAAAGVEPGAEHVGFEGADVTERFGESFGYGASIPLGKAFSPEVILADKMNGAALPAEHGAPLRVVVPGFIGARQVKWLTRIEVRREASANYFQSVAYRLYPRALRAATFDPRRDGSLGEELTELEVNSVICQPLTGESVPAGPVVVRGVAYTGGDRTIERVEVSLDAGANWVEARFVDAAADPYLWRLFEAVLVPPPGPAREIEVVARAHDSGGFVQPRDVAATWNFKGYMNNAWSRVSFWWG